MHSELDEADNQFFLGLYRCAVAEYQPKIEKRTGVTLGDITVRDYREIDQDFMRDLERTRLSWITRLFRRSTIKSRLTQWRDYLNSTHTERAGGCMASYYRNAIYVSFSRGTSSHESAIAFAAVHELSHALWERLAGKRLFPTPQGTATDRENFELLVEGFATYAERIWFLDVYPKSVQKSVEHAGPTRDSVYYKGMKRIEEIVEQHGQRILFEIPKRWRDF